MSFLCLGSISSKTSNAIKNLSNEFKWRCRSFARHVPSSIVTMVRALRSAVEREKSTGRGSDKASMGEMVSRKYTRSMRCRKRQLFVTSRS